MKLSEQDEYLKIRDLEQAKIIIFDGNNLAHRARNTINLSYQGEDTSILYGVVKSITSVLKSESANLIIVCWDYGVPDFRRQLVDTYKDHDRSDDPTWPRVIEQMKILHEMLPKFGVLSLRLGGSEADDLMAQVSRMLVGHKTIVSTDRDMYHCIKEDVQVHSPVKDIRVTHNSFKKYAHVPKLGYLLYRAIIGDGSDGIPGVKGIGGVGADKIINGNSIFSLDVLFDIMEDKLPASYVSKIKDTGYDNMKQWMEAMDLSTDRVGATSYIQEAIQTWDSFQRKEVVQFLNDYSFATLKDATLFSKFRTFIDPLELLKDQFVPAENPLKF